MADDLLTLVKAALAEADRQREPLFAARLAECVALIEAARRRRPRGGDRGDPGGGDAAPRPRYPAAP